MTIAALWREDEFLWCAADSRLTVGDRKSQTTTDMMGKIFSIPLAVRAFGDDGLLRAPHYRTQYGFTYAGSASPALMTAATASTFFQNLARPGGQSNPPRFEQVAESLTRIAERFMRERRRLGANGLFSAAFFGWCPHSNSYKIAHIDGRDDAGFRVELSYPSSPNSDGEPWLLLGDGQSSFNDRFSNWSSADSGVSSRIPRRIIEIMVADESIPTVGGSVSMGVAFPGGFDLFCSVEPIVSGHSAARRIFNGLDLDEDVGGIDGYIVATTGLA